MGVGDVKSKLQTYKQKLRVYFTETIWQPVPEDAPIKERILRRFARYLWLGGHRLADGDLMSRSSSLTLQVLLSIVPVLAVGFSLSKGLGLESERLRSMLVRLFSGHEEIVERLLNYVEHTDVRALGTVGLLFLIYSAVSLLGRIEISFNKIWGVKHNRPLVRKFADYLSVLLIFPLLMVSATTITASVSASSFGVWLQSAPLLSWVFKLLPFVIVWAAFTFIYVFMPNTKVSVKAGMAGAFVAALVWSLVQWGYIYFQVGVSKYNAIYGTFAALPIFLVWLNLSWTIVLLGCEIVFVVQHERTYHPHHDDAPPLSIEMQEKVALFFVSRVWSRFVVGEVPYRAGAMAAESDLRMSDCLAIIDALVMAGLLRWAREPEDGLLPARDLSKMSVGEVLSMYREQGGNRDGEVAVTVADLHRDMKSAIESELSKSLESLSPSVQK